MYSNLDPDIQARRNGSSATRPKTLSSDIQRSVADVVEDVLNGNKDAFGELYDSFAPLVRSICFDATHDLNLAQDLAQEAFLRSYRNLQSLIDYEKFGPWLFGITNRVVKEWQRAKRRDRHRYFGSNPQILDDQQPDVGSPFHDHLLGELAELPERERVALHAFYLQERSAGSARLLLGLSQSGFYKLLDRARKMLAARILENFEES